MYRGYEDLELIGFEDEAHILSEGKRNRNKINASNVAPVGFYGGALALQINRHRGPYFPEMFANSVNLYRFL